MVRRLKSEVLKDLPPKIRQVIPLSGDYSKHLNLFYELLEEMDFDTHLDQWDYEEAIVFFMQACQEFMGRLSGLRKDLSIAKVPEVCGFIEEALETQDKVVVFAHHHETLDGIYEHLTKLGLDVVRIDGRSSPEHRDCAVDRFQNGEARVFVGGIKVAGVGLTLTASSHVIFAEIDWVPANLVQAEDRCHRIGQDRGTLVQYLMVEHSLDYKMWYSILQKMESIQRVLD